MRNLHRLLLAALGLTTVLLHGCAALTPRLGIGPQRHALVIGNSAYAHMEKLKAPKVNAEQVEARLIEKERFAPQNVTTRKNVETAAELERIVVEFARKVNGGDVVMIYYSGHGLQDGDHNYLVPTEAPSISTPRSELTPKLMSLDALRHALLHNSKGTPELVFIMLDACRTDVTQTSKADVVRPGFHPINVKRDTLVFYASEAALQVNDNEDGLTALTAQFVNHLDKQADLQLTKLLESVSEDVLKKAKDQRPVVYGSPTVRFCFDRCRERPVVIPTN
jgi:uncharacterized caspase-like protein